MILGFGVLGYKGSCSPTPTHVDDITTIKLKDGFYDDLYIGSDISEPLTPTIPDRWLEDTMFHAKFNGNTSAGNFGMDMDAITDILIKRRIKGTNIWTTINRKSIEDSKSEEEFNLTGVDYFAQARTKYEYAVVMYYSGIEGNYNIVDADSNFDCIVMAEKDQSYSTLLEVGACDMKRIGSSSIVEMLNKKYPVYYKYGKKQYETGTVDGYWIRYSCDTYADNDGLDLDGLIPYMTEVKDYFNDGKAKILKHPDGRIWLVAVNDSDGITDARQDDIMLERTLSFNVTEIGDYNSEQDLYELGLSDVSSEYWSRTYV